MVRGLSMKDRETLPGNWLQQMTKEEVVESIAVAWLDLPSGHTVLVEDLLTEDQLAKLERNSAARTQTLKGSFGPMSKSSTGKPRGPNSDMKRRTYLKIMARGMAERGSHDAQHCFALVQDLLLQNEHCSSCRIKLTFDREHNRDQDAIARDGDDRHYTNASPDRIVPQIKGGDYTRPNTQMLCLGCQCLKHVHSSEEATTLARTVAFQGTSSLDDSGMLAPLPLERPQSTQEDDDYIEAWSRFVLQRCQASGRKSQRKKGTLSLSSLIALVREVYVRNGCHQNPLSLSSVDRVDPQGPYSKDNCRLLCIGLDGLRGNARNDAILHSYIGTLREQLSVQELPSEALPGSEAFSCWRQQQHFHWPDPQDELEAEDLMDELQWSDDESPDQVRCLSVPGGFKLGRVSPLSLPNHLPPLVVNRQFPLLLLPSSLEHRVVCCFPPFVLCSRDVCPASQCQKISCTIWSDSTTPHQREMCMASVRRVVALHLPCLCRKPIICNGCF